MYFSKNQYYTPITTEGNRLRFSTRSNKQTKKIVFFFILFATPFAFIEKNLLQLFLLVISI